MPDPYWWRRGLCAEIGPEFFFPSLGDNAHEATATCDLCQVRVMCLADSIKGGDIEYGVYGGFGRDTRRTLQRRVMAGESPLAVAGQAVAVDRHRRG